MKIRCEKARAKRVGLRIPKERFRVPSGKGLMGVLVTKNGQLRGDFLSSGIYEYTLGFHPQHPNLACYVIEREGDAKFYVIISTIPQQGVSLEAV